MNQDQRSVPRVPKRVCGGHDTRTNNRSQLCKSRYGGAVSLKNKKRRTREKERGEEESFSRRNARMRENNLVNALKKRVART